MPLVRPVPGAGQLRRPFQVQDRRVYHVALHLPYVSQASVKLNFKDSVFNKISQTEPVKNANSLDPSKCTMLAVSSRILRPFRDGLLTWWGSTCFSEPRDLAKHVSWGIQRSQRKRVDRTVRGKWVSKCFESQFLFLWGGHFLSWFGAEGRSNLTHEILQFNFRWQPPQP